MKFSPYLSSDSKFTQSRTLQLSIPTDSTFFLKYFQLNTFHIVKYFRFFPSTSVIPDIILNLYIARLFYFSELFCICIYLTVHTLPFL